MKKNLRLMDILKESIFVKENRVSLHRISINLEKVLPELAKRDQDKLNKLFAEIVDFSEELNATPYTKFNIYEWQVHVADLRGKLEKLHETVEKISNRKNKKESLNCGPLMMAIKEAIQS